MSSLTINLFLVYILYVVIHSIQGISLIDSFITERRDIIRFQLVKMKSGFEHFMETALDLKIIQGVEDINNLKQFQAGSDTLPLFKYFDTEYYGLINIGKPGKQFKMIFDTAWGDSWVPSIKCPKIKLACAVHNRYDSSASATYKPDNTPFNISGQFVGYMSKDVFNVGHMNSTNQSFAELSQLPWIYSLVHADGIVGLALKGPYLGKKTFFYNLYQQNKLKLKSEIFSIYINRDPSTTHGGSILFGGIDSKHQRGEFTSIDIISDDDWKFRMNKVLLIKSSQSKVAFCINGCTATADTSSNSIVGPPDDIKTINAAIGAESFIFNRYLIPCVQEHKGPKLNFTIGNTNFQILGRDYVQKLSYSGFTICLSAFEPASQASMALSDWRLGGAFLYQFYTAFDVKNKKFMISEAA